MITIIGITILSLYLYMTAWFLYALHTKNNGVADVAWGLGFILVALETLILGGTYTVSQCITTFFIIIWGTRLSWHIHKRNKNKPEDARYALLRQKWQNNVTLNSFIYVFMLQATLILVISTPLFLINTTYAPHISLLTGIGICLWIVGFLFECIADYQLKQFLSAQGRSGRVMKYGLWRYSRHPNYFGESLMWWALWCIALPLPYGYLALISPVTITYFLLYISGIPLLEKEMMKNIEYQEYAKITSIFIPWFPSSKT